MIFLVPAANSIEGALVASFSSSGSGMATSPRSLVGSSGSIQWRRMPPNKPAVAACAPFLLCSRLNGTGRDSAAAAASSAGVIEKPLSS